MTKHALTKLGIACVYFFRDSDAWLLDMQLDFIEKTTDVEFVVYASAARLQEPLKSSLAARPFVQVIDFPPFDGEGGPEHGHYLTELVKYAHQDGCSHVCTLDCDSFPIKKGWPSELFDQMGDDYDVAAVFRAENEDTDLPHPCGTFMATRLLDTLDFSFWPNEAVLQSAEFQSYLHETKQRFDTGSGLGYALWRKNVQWLKLFRSNRTDLHFIMAGIYSDVFFHLGASSRRPAFHQDYQNKLGPWLSVILKTIPILWRISRWLEDRYLEKNQRLADEIRTQIKKDPDVFIKSLQK